MPRETVAELIVDVLQESGVKNVYALLSNTSNPIKDAISNSSIDLMAVSSEDLAIFAASAESSISGQLTLCIDRYSHLNFAHAIVQVQQNGSPIIVILTLPELKHAAKQLDRIANLKNLYRHHSIYHEHISDPKSADKAMQLACQTALSLRCVVVITLNEELCSARVTRSNSYPLFISKPVACPSHDEMRQLIAMIGAGERIAIICGSGCEDAHDQLVAFAAKLGAPMICTPRAKDLIAYDNPYFVGVVGEAGLDSSYHVMSDYCDTMILLGVGPAMTRSVLENTYITPLHKKVKVIQIDRSASQLGIYHPIHMGVVGEIKDILEALIPLLNERLEHPLLDECLRHYKKNLRVIKQESNYKHPSVIYPHHLFKLIDLYAVNDALFVTDDEETMISLLRHIHTNGKRRIFCHRVHSSTAHAFAQALGLQRAYPNRQIILILGDHHLDYLLDGLALAANYELRIKTVLLNEKSSTKKRFDYVKIANLIGFYGRNAMLPNYVEESVQDFLQHQGLALIDVQITAFTPEATLHKLAAPTHSDESLFALRHALVNDRHRVLS